MKKRPDFFWIFLISGCLLLQPLLSPAQTQGESRQVIAGAEYAAGGLKQLLAGRHWRDLWTTPFSAPVLDLAAFAGGLVPIRRGGGMQTKSLRLQGADGRQYKFRSIDKDPARGLPPDLRESVVADILKDQISVTHPLSAIVVAPLLNAVDILNAEPRVCIMPDSDILGEYRAEFGGLLGMIEEHPDEGDDGQPGFAGADKVVGGFKILKQIESGTDERVDGVEFLKARLMDIYIGDRDRHADQWRWAGFRNDDDIRWWKPIPRDRDFAFPLYDGIFPSLSTVFIVSHVSFGYTYPAMFDITFSGRHLDRRFLGSLPKPTWDSIATFISTALTDSVIDGAVNRMPAEWVKKEGNHISSKLKMRRDALPQAAEEFYRLIAGFADMYGSDKDEYADIERLDDEQVRVRIYRKAKKSRAPRGEPVWEHTFHCDYTNEIRVNLLGGDDYAIVRGTVGNSIRVLVDGGAGDDELVDSSYVRGNFLLLTPIPDAENLTKFYDNDPETSFVCGPGTDVYRAKPSAPEEAEMRLEPLVENRGREWAFSPWLAYSSDDGLTFGGGPIMNRFDFKADPYDFSMELKAAYATDTEGYDIIYNGDFTQVLHGTRLHVFAELTQLEINRYYGFGNETVLDDGLAERRFYHIAQNLLRLEPTLTVALDKRTSLRFGVYYNFSEIDSLFNTLLNEEKPYGIGRLSGFGFITGLRWDTRDNHIAPQSGLFLDVEGRYNTKFFNTRFDFAKLRFDVRSYLSGHLLSDITLALRLTGGKNWGTFPFHESALIGGRNSLRGFGRDRFAGDAALATQTELRVFLSKLYFGLPGRFGLFAFSDNGRVFLSGESSTTWHNALGGGLWMTFLDRRFALSVAYGGSRERDKFYVSTRFMY